MNNKPIFLIGPMGAGKSAVGKRLAQKLNINFYDMDSIIENDEKRSIKDIFGNEGEAYFRKIERGTLIKLSDKGKCIVSTGGGTPTYLDNLSIMKNAGRVITLIASPKLIYERLKNSNIVRPLLLCENPAAKIISIMQARAYYYLKGDIIIDSDKKTIAEIASEIEEII